MNRLLPMILLGTALAASPSLTALRAADAQTEGSMAATEEEMQLRKELEGRIAEIQASPEKLKEAMALGQERTPLCKTCHGADGIAVKPLVPNLAGQNPVYIADQFLRFKDGRRNDFMMSNLAKTFTKEDKMKIAIFYSSLPSKAVGGGKTELIAQGKALFQAQCSGCHGADAKGQEGYARLAGQQPDYTVKMLKEFRDRTGKRYNAWMSAVAMKLKDEDMDAVAAFLASLK